MVETDLIPAECDSSASSPSQDRRLVLDLVIAGLICLAAAAYWFWDAKTSEPPANPASPITSAPSKPLTRDSFNDEGFRLYSAGDYAGAEAQFQRGISANPRAAVGHCN